LPARWRAALLGLLLSLGSGLSQAAAPATLAYVVEGSVQGVRARCGAAGGEPPRLVAPGRVCWSSVKWVDRLEVLAEETATTGEALARARLQR